MDDQSGVNMNRKSVSYLTSIRHEVSATAKEMHELSVDLEEATGKLLEMTPEQIRSDKATTHTSHMKYLYSASYKLRKAIKAHNLASDKLKSFF